MKKHIKINDWVISEKGISTITDIKFNGRNCESKVFFSNGICMFEYDVELWQQTTGEWCWFSDNGFEEFIFGQFLKIQDGLYYGVSSDGKPFAAEYCQPFIGNFPISY